MLPRTLRLSLQLIQDHLHRRVLEDADHFRILKRPFTNGFGIVRGGSRSVPQTLHGLDVGGIDLQRLLKGVLGLGVVLEGNTDVAFANEALDEGGIQFDAFVAVFQGEIEFHEFAVGGGAIRVNFCVVWIAF